MHALGLLIARCWVAVVKCAEAMPGWKTRGNARLARAGYGLLALGLFAWQGEASAQLAPAPPTKTITIFNNSDDALYPVIEAPIRLGADVRDLWLQAQLGVKEAEYKTRPFQTTKLYRIWINHDQGGVPPHGSVTITLPFYTQLQPWTADNSGQVVDQFVDWWNAMRVFVFDGKDAAVAAYDFSQDNARPPTPIKPVLPPYPVTPIKGAAVPGCTGCTLDLRAYYVGFPWGIPAQLIEYTLASAEGPPNQTAFKINLGQVNYNISAVDSVYLPAAIGAKDNSSELNTWLGSAQDVATFRKQLNEFAAQGAQWPQFIPAYYLPGNPIGAIASPNGPPNGIKPYPQPRVPSANLVLAESFKTRAAPRAPAPPTLTSYAETPWVEQSSEGQLGKIGQATLDLWNKCTAGGADTTTCKQIRTVKGFFVADYKACFGREPDFGDQDVLHDFLRDVYGWAQFAGCAQSLADKNPTGYPVVIKTFCDLMYNFFTVADPSEVFDPYVMLVHLALASNAYAFSIDDAQAFKSIPGTGLIITIAGTQGLENPKQTELPTKDNYGKFCQSGPPKPKQ
jgi:hypothetical protein